MPALHRRNDASSISSPIIIAGLAVVGAIVLGVSLWLSVRFLRQRSQQKREAARGAAFLSVRGLVRDGENDREKSELPDDDAGMNGHLFSRRQLNTSVPMPAKALVPSAQPSTDPLSAERERESVYEFYSTSNTVPKPFSPFSFALAASSGSTLNPNHTPTISVSAPPSPTGDSFFSPPSPSHSHSPSPSGNRGSWRSSLFNVGARLSFATSERRSSTASAASMASSHGKRKVRQLFNPVLPDELVLNLGESITVMQSHDDGWCIVARDKPFIKGEIEMGAVPAWCFIKPVKGLRAERPVRSASLGVTVQLDGPGFESRSDLVSWSNF